MNQLNGIRILIVDDEAFIREMFREEFEAMGAVAVSAENGSIAFSIIQMNAFDVVISDIRMPGGNGIELMQNICKQIAPLPKMILCTGFSEDDIKEAEKIGVDQILTKPFEWEDLVATVTKSLESKVS